jgi:hypothetical protein
MAQAGYTPIQLYNSATPAAVPTAGNLLNGELAINTADEVLYFKNSAGTVKKLAAAIAAVINGGTGQTSYTDGQLLIGNSVGNTLTKATLTAGSGVSITNGNGSITIAATGSGGTVTSVGGTGTVNGITLTGTVTSSGNLTLGGTLSGVSLTTQVTGILPVANGGTGITSLGSGVATFLGTPSSANLAAAVTDETGSGALVFATSPALTTPNLGTPSAATLTNATGLPIVNGTTGTLSVARGGTGDTSYTNGQLLIGNTTGNTLTKATLTAGSGISITNGSGSISIAATGGSGTVTSVGGTGTVNGITLTGTVTSSGNLTLGGTLSGVSLTSQVSGILPVANGGTNNAFFAVSGPASSAKTFTFPNASATVLTTNAAVTVAQGGTGATTLTGVVKGNGTSAFTAGTVALGSEVSGTLPVANGGTGATTLTGVLKGNGTGAFTAATAGTDFVAPATATSFTAKQTFSGSTSALAAVFANSAEVCTVSATAATGTVNYDVTTQSVLYYTSNASGNWTLNVRGNSSTSLNSILNTGQSVTVAFLVTNGGTAYYPTALNIDGSAVTPKWQGGSAPAAGNASSIDVYTYTIVKTASATFTVFASQTKFA